MWIPQKRLINEHYLRIRNISCYSFFNNQNLNSYFGFVPFPIGQTLRKTLARLMRTAMDVSSSCVETMRGVDQRVEWCCGDAFAMPEDWSETFDLVIDKGLIGHKVWSLI